MTIDSLQKLELFRSLTKNETEFLLSISISKTYAKGDILFFENDNIEDIYYLKSGIVKFYKVDRFDNEIFLYNSYKNELLSEPTNYGNAVSFSNAEFLDNGEVIKINFLKFQDLIKNNATFMYDLLSEFSKKVRRFQGVINREIVFDGTAKVAHFISSDLESFNKMKKQEIAYMLNIQPETLSRILRKLSRNGIIAANNQCVEIIDDNKLSTIFK